jgi:hypothetical protein
MKKNQVQICFDSPQTLTPRYTIGFQLQDLRKITILHKKKLHNLLDKYVNAAILGQMRYRIIELCLGGADLLE